MRRTLGLPTFCTVLACCALMTGCGEDVAPETTAEELVASGWWLFESGDFRRALETFDRALDYDCEHPDAYNGRGWCDLNLDQLAEAVLDFDKSLAVGARTPDPFAGQSIGYRDLDTENHFEMAVAAADSALAREPRYVFSHNSSFDWKDLRLIMAQSYFALTEYDLANVQVDSLGGDVQDPQSETFVADLLAEIQNLGLEIAGE